jgi:hypothetical protein
MGLFEEGVMINFLLHGLIHYEELESDIRLSARAEPKGSE